MQSNFLTTDGSTFALQPTLDANYSHLDPNALGQEAAQFGTLFLDGTSGSSVASLSDPIVPNGEDLTQNNDALETVGWTIGGPESHDVLANAEGQEFTNPLALGAVSPATIVFAADLSSIPEIGQDWTLSFGGVMVDGGTSEVGVEFSTDGNDFQTLSPVSLSGSAAAYSVSATGSGDQAFFRLDLEGVNPGRPTLDNVAINTTLVPEPGTALLLGGGLAGLAGLGRRRRA